MTQELNLTALVHTLQRRWLLILFVVTLVVIPTLLYSLMRPPVYYAQAELLTLTPKYQWRFSPSTLSIVDARRDWRREFMLLGQTKQVARRAASQLEPSASAGNSSNSNGDALLSRVSVRPSGVDRIIVEASGSTPQAAAALANAWSKALQAEVDERYGTVLEARSLIELQATFKAQLDEAQRKIDAFKAETGQDVAGSGFLEAAGLEPDQKELESKARLLADYRVALDSLNRLADEIAQARAGQRAPDSVAWELLQNPILLQRAALRPDKLPPQTDLAAFSALLQREAAALEDIVAWLNKDVVNLQTQLADEESQLYRLRRERDLASDAYDTIVRKLKELEIQQTIDPTGVKILEEAALPESPRSWSLIVRLLVAVVGGLIAGVWLALLWEYLFAQRSAATGTAGAAR